MKLIEDRQMLEWAYNASRDCELSNPEFRAEALVAARAIMRLVRARVEFIVERLLARGYEFQYPESAFKPPSDDAEELAAEFQAHGLHLPISFQAWLQEVGSVNFVGKDPSWPALSVIEKGEGDGTLADPLQVEYPHDYFLSELEDWKVNRHEYGADYAGPFIISFSADYLHKANISGGAEYGVMASDAAVDPVVLYERRCLRFMAYVLYSLSYSGCVGFDKFTEPDHPFVRYLVGNT